MVTLNSTTCREKCGYPRAVRLNVDNMGKIWVFPLFLWGIFVSLGGLSEFLGIKVDPWVGLM